MFNPPHPGGILLEDVLPELNVSIVEFATRVDFDSEALSRIAHGHAPICADLAARLEHTGISTARLWLALQGDYDRWQAQHGPSLHSR